MTLQEWEEQQDRELDEQLSGLFRSATPPVPTGDFASRTLAAARHAPLSTGRRRLRRPWTFVAGWTAVVAMVTAMTAAAIFRQPALTAAFASVLAMTIRLGFWMLSLMQGSSMLVSTLGTAAGVFAKALATREAAIVVSLLAAVGLFSLSMLTRLLFSEKESSSW